MSPIQLRGYGTWTGQLQNMTEITTFILGMHNIIGSIIRIGHKNTLSEKGNTDYVIGFHQQTFD